MVALRIDARKDTIEIAHARLPLLTILVAATNRTGGQASRSGRSSPQVELHVELIVATFIEHNAG